MLIDCNECGNRISDKAIFCPHCGLPMQKGALTSKRKTRMRLPNGFGQISKISNQNLRNPYRVLVPNGKDETGRYKTRLLKPKAYFATYNEAYAALTEYWKNPGEVKHIKVNDLYEQWKLERYRDYSEKYTHARLDFAWKYCASTYDMDIRDVRASHIKYCMYDAAITSDKKGLRTASDSTIDRIKIIWNLLFDYAVENEYTDRNYAREVKMRVKKKTGTTQAHTAYNEEELNRLIASSGDNVYSDMVLIQCLSGWRPSEVCNLKVSDTNIQEWTVTGGSKTESGINRTVPIHPAIRDLIKIYYEEAVNANRENLFTTTTKKLPITYHTFQAEFKNVKERLKLDASHSPHDGRKTFITLAKNAGVDEYAIKKLVGHTVSDLTERVYTERKFSWLAKEVEKISIEP